VAEDPGHQAGQLGAGERVELQALGAAAPLHLVGGLALRRFELLARRRASLALT
jgi:hypothetical protein